MPFDNGPGYTLYYGYGIYGQDVYGDGFQEPISATTGVYLVQNGYCPRYLRFQFSGATLPLYVFDLNPSSYDPYPQRTTQSYSLILNFDTTIDQDYNKIEVSMNWDRMPETMWESLLPYTRKKVDGTSERLYFWDSTIGRARESLVKVEEFQGEVVAGETPIDRHSVSMKLRFV